MFYDRDAVTKAADLIRTFGHGGRYEELADAEKAPL